MQLPVIRPLQCGGGENLNMLKGGCLGAVIVGGIGFSLGFFGPLIFTPEANQGPLLGILITGPLGAVAGAIGGAIVAARKR